MEVYCIVRKVTATLHVVIEPKTSVSIGNDLTTSAKFTFEILDLKHIYNLFTVRELQTTNYDGRGGAKLKHIIFKISLLGMIQKFTGKEIWFFMMCICILL